MKYKVSNFDLADAFKALDELPTPTSSGKKVRPNRVNLHEMFSLPAKTELLVEDYYDVNDNDDMENAADDREAEVAQAKLARIEKIVDLDAKSPEDLLPSYTGKVIIECPQCMTKLYKNAEDIEKDETDPTICNVNEPCQVCGNLSGYTIVGKVAPVEDEEMADFTGDETGDLDLDLGETEGGEEATDDLDLDLDLEGGEGAEEGGEDELDLDLDLDLGDEEEEEEDTNESLHKSKFLANAAKKNQLKSKKDSDNLTLNEDVADSHLEAELAADQELVNQPGKATAETEDTKTWGKFTVKRQRGLIKPNLETKIIEESAETLTEDASDVMHAYAEDDKYKTGAWFMLAYVNPEKKEVEVTEPFKKQQAQKIIDQVKAKGFKPRGAYFISDGSLGIAGEEDLGCPIYESAEALTEAAQILVEKKQKQASQFFKRYTARLYDGKAPRNSNFNKNATDEFTKSYLHSDIATDIDRVINTCKTASASSEWKDYSFVVVGHPKNSTLPLQQVAVLSGGKMQTDLLKDAIGRLSAQDPELAQKATGLGFKDRLAKWNQDRKDNKFHKAANHTRGTADHDSDYKHTLQYDDPELEDDTDDEILDNAPEASETNPAAADEPKASQSQATAQTKDEKPEEEPTEFNTPAIKAADTENKADKATTPAPEQPKNVEILDPERPIAKASQADKDYIDAEFKELPSEAQNLVKQLAAPAAEQVLQFMQTDSEFQQKLVNEFLEYIKNKTKLKDDDAKKAAELTYTVATTALANNAAANTSLQPSASLNNSFKPLKASTGLVENFAAIVEKYEAALTEDAEIDLPAEVSDADFKKLMNSPEFQKPISDSEVEQLLNADDYDTAKLEEIDEDSVEECLQEALKAVYTNVTAFTLTECTINSKGNLIFEGIITFESGNTRPTTYTFNKIKKLNENMLHMTGSNEMLAANGRFIMEGCINKNKLQARNFTYSYNIGKNVVEGKVNSK